MNWKRDAETFTCFQSRIAENVWNDRSEHVEPVLTMPRDCYSGQRCRCRRESIDVLIRLITNIIV